MRAFTLALAACATLLAAACLPVATKAPLGASMGPGADKALVGAWKVFPAEPSDDGPGYLHVLRSKEGMTALLVSTGKPDGSSAGEWNVYAVSTARLGGHSYLNARAVSADGKPVTAEEARINIPLLYRVRADGSIAVYLMDEDAAKTAVKAGRIAGTVREGSSGDVVITASPQEQDKFFAGEGARLFSQTLMVLKRVK